MPTIYDNTAEMVSVEIDVVTPHHELSVHSDLLDQIDAASVDNLMFRAADMNVAANKTQDEGPAGFPTYLLTGKPFSIYAFLMAYGYTDAAEEIWEKFNK